MVFKMKAFSGFKQKVDHQKDMEDQIAGPIRKKDVGPVSKETKRKSIEQENQIESMIEEVGFDIENGKISKVEGNKKIASLKSKLKKLKG